MWDLIVSVPDHCLSFYLAALLKFSMVYLINHLFILVSGSGTESFNNVRSDGRHEIIETNLQNESTISSNQNTYMLAIYKV